ncbi:MAG: YbhB/YbcL family Raf kinase inhibitor-like protein [Chitinophagaceae bacterium]
MRIAYLTTSIILLLISCKKSTDSLTHSSTAPLPLQLKFSGNGFSNLGTYPKLFTCDSLGISPGLQWSNAPTTTKSYAITMYTIPPTGDKHVYMVLYNLPNTISSIPDNASSIGSWGINTVDGKNTYTPPCSQGPGPKIYILTLYALSAENNLNFGTSKVTMDMLYTQIKTKIVDSALMSVTYTRP